jgi:hypothetical protein
VNGNGCEVFRPRNHKASLTRTMNGKAPQARTIGGSIGQPDAGVLSGGSYQLNGGFWGGASINYTIYLPLALKNF